MLLLAARAPALQRDAEENKQQAKEPALSKKRRHTAGRKDSSQSDQEGDEPPRHRFALKDIPKNDSTEVKAEDGDSLTLARVLQNMHMYLAPICSGPCCFASPGILDILQVLSG